MPRKSSKRSRTDDVITSLDYEDLAGIPIAAQKPDKKFVRAELLVPDERLEKIDFRELVNEFRAEPDSPVHERVKQIYRNMPPEARRQLIDAIRFPSKPATILAVNHHARLAKRVLDILRKFEVQDVAGQGGLPPDILGGGV